MKILGILFIIVFNLNNAILCLDNGLARTPPMGWLAWERFGCNVKCDTDPHNCISEKLFMDMAEILEFDGFKDAGYVYVNIDDCWMAPERDKKGNLVPDRARFPRGIKFLANYMHVRGFKLGIYQDYGIRTCMGYPGIIGHMEQDAKKFIEWGVDMLKLDGCHSKLKELDWGYITMGKYLRNDRKPILYSCSWPYYQLISKIEPNYELISSHCNMWRNFHDIHDSWESISEVIDFFGDNQEVIAPYIGPGRWADPDMIMIGNHHLSYGQSRIQMAVWSMIPGPLLMSNDLRAIKKEHKDILINKRVIAVNQDPLGFPGKRIYKENMIEVWKRSISPASGAETSLALLFINRNNSMESVIKFPFFELSSTNETAFNITELFTGNYLGVYKGVEILKIIVPSMDAVFLGCEILD